MRVLCNYYVRKIKLKNPIRPLLINFSTSPRTFMRAQLVHDKMYRFMTEGEWSYFFYSIFDSRIFFMIQRLKIFFSTLLWNRDKFSKFSKLVNYIII